MWGKQTDFEGQTVQELRSKDGLTRSLLIYYVIKISPYFCSLRKGGAFELFGSVGKKYKKWKKKEASHSLYGEIKLGFWIYGGLTYSIVIDCMTFSKVIFCPFLAKCWQK
jgi:hypothetical protein